MALSSRLELISLRLTTCFNYVVAVFKFFFRYVPIAKCMKCYSHIKVIRILFGYKESVASRFNLKVIYMFTSSISIWFRKFRNLQPASESAKVQLNTTATAANFLKTGLRPTFDNSIGKPSGSYENIYVHDLDAPMSNEDCVCLLVVARSLCFTVHLVTKTQNDVNIGEPVKVASYFTDTAFGNIHSSSEKWELFRKCSLNKVWGMQASGGIYLNCLPLLKLTVTFKLHSPERRANFYI